MTINIWKSFIKQFSLYVGYVIRKQEHVILQICYCFMLLLPINLDFIC